MRTLKLTFSHLIVTGNEGTGKKSLLKLVSFIMQLKLIDSSSFPDNKNLVQDSFNSPESILMVTLNRIPDTQLNELQFFAHTAPGSFRLTPGNATLHLVFLSTNDFTCRRLYTEYPILFRMCRVINFQYNIKEMVEGIGLSFLQSSNLSQLSDLNWTENAAVESNEDYLVKQKVNFNEIMDFMFETVQDPVKFRISLNHDDIQIQFNFKKFKHFLMKFKSLISANSKRLEKLVQQYSQLFQNLAQIHKKQSELKQWIEENEVHKQKLNVEINEMVQQIQILKYFPLN